MKYYRLTDRINQDEIVKKDNEYSYSYHFGAEKWVKTGILLRYQWPDDDLFGQYTEVSLSEADRLMNIQRDRLNKLYLTAREVAGKAHEGQFDKGGHPYINHPVKVADSLESTEHKIVALLHDVLEDSGITADELKTYGFTDRIIIAICILTKDKSMNYTEYLSSVRTNNIAWMVKMADLKHNMDLSRIPDPTEKDLKRIEKYKEALDFLEN